ncbi:group 1 truncated hemoglobin [uncultured Nostoc sp.]|uniref:group I truncated hemoglobin n=1 Tax=uncultured Nostoc sp. TaxID=340711 RepID=UPI0035CA0CEC
MLLTSVDTFSVFIYLYIVWFFHAVLLTNSKERLRQLLVDQFCEATGGPCVYTGRTTKLSHNGIGTGLTNSEFNAFYNDVAKALDENKVPLAEKTEVLTFVNSFRKDIVEK